MTRVICVTSGKGGAGKTTMTANLGLALTEIGYKTLVIDANLTTPNLGFHLGVPLYPKTLHDVLKGQAKVDEAIYFHPTGLKVVPAGISIEDLKGTRADRLSRAVLSLIGQHDVVLLDGAAGLGKEPLAGIEAADEALVVTNPNLPATTDALKTIKIAEELGTHVLGVVLNKVKGHGSELTASDVEAILGYPVLAQVPFDNEMDEALAVKNPLVAHAPTSRTSIEIKKLAASLVGVQWEPPALSGFSLFSRLFGFLKR